MKTTKKHFEQFKKECERLQYEWGLTNWRLVFHWEDLSHLGHNANNSRQLSSYLVNLTLAYDIDDDTSVKRLAKHEMIHVLLARFALCGLHRHTTADEMTESEEETVRMLEKLL